MIARADEEHIVGVAEPGPMRRYGLAAAVLIPGLLVSYLIFHALRSAEVMDAERQFAILSGEQRDLLQKEIDAHLEVVAGVRALFDSSEFVNAHEFERYTRQALERNMHMHALEWIPRVAFDRRAAFEAEASKALDIEYRIRERDNDDRIRVAAQRDEYRPVYYSQARDGKARLGIDTYNRPENARAMDTAARRNAPAAARVVIREPDVPQIELVFIYLPVFDKTDGRLTGFVRTSVALGEMVRDAAHESSAIGIAVELLDSSKTVPAAVAPPLTWQVELSIVDVPIALRFLATDAYTNAPRLQPLYALFAGGVLIAFMGAVAMLQLTKRRLRLQALTRTLTQEVAERRLSEQRLSSSETRYRVLVENSPDAIILQLNDRIVFANAACVRLFRVRSVDDVIGKSVFDLASPEYHDVIRERMKFLVERRVGTQPMEQAIVAADGTRVPVEVLSVPFETDAGTVIQVTARDITQRKLDEAERKRLEAALRQSQRVEALGTLAGGIAHDFNNILTAIIGNTRLLLSDLSEPHAAHKTGSDILNAAHRARDLVKRIAAFSQKQDAQRSAVAVVPLLQEIQGLLRATLPAGIEISLRAAAESLWALGDATQIHQVLLNICTNAWQAIAGAGRVEIFACEVDADTAAARSMIALADSGRYVCIEIRDDGVGIQPDVAERIFEPFFTTKGPGQGSGLGLAVVYGILQNHRGGIAVRSRPGEGTSFFVYLPACEAPSETRAAFAKGNVSGAKQHVLYVDDEEAIVFLVKRLLERDGYRCTGVHNAEKAIARVRETPDDFDLVVTDLNMPGMSGLDLTRELKLIRPDLPVVITTGYVRADDVAAAKEIGAHAVVLKPDTIEAMGALVQSHLQ